MMILMILMTLMIPRTWTWPHEFYTMMILMILMNPRIWTWPNEFYENDDFDDFDDFDDSSYMDLAK